VNPSEQIDHYIADHDGWRGERLAALRGLINAAGPDLREDWKWGSPVWRLKSNVVSIGGFKEHVKLNFFKGAELDDPKGLFNNGLDSKTTRSIDLRQDDVPDETAIQELVRAAVVLDGDK